MKVDWIICAVPDENYRPAAARSERGGALNLSAALPRRVRLGVDGWASVTESRKRSTA
jgi:hypothetical protein